MFSINGHFRACLELFSLVQRHRILAIEMARREIFDRYSGQILGAYWAIGHPIFMIGLYVFIFAVVFKQKIGGSYEMPLSYTAYILAGIIPWMTIQDVMSKSCTVITANASLVKQTIFPLEVLPIKSVLASLLTQLISTLILVLYVLWTQGGLPATYLLLPVLLFLQIGVMLGIAFLFSTIGVFLRDTKDVVQLFATAGMYLLPVFYLPTWVPPLFKPLLYANPFSYVIWCYQDALYFGRFEHPWAWLVFALFSFFGMLMGYRMFRRMKSTFGNML